MPHPIDGFVGSAGQADGTEWLSYKTRTYLCDRAIATGVARRFAPPGHPRRLLAVLCGTALLAGGGNAAAQSPSPPRTAPPATERVAAVSGNPAATNYSTGTGWLGRTLGLRDEWGVTLGGLWLADTNVVVAGGVQPGGWTNNRR